MVAVSGSLNDLASTFGVLLPSAPLTLFDLVSVVWPLEIFDPLASFRPLNDDWRFGFWLSVYWNGRG